MKPYAVSLLTVLSGLFLLAIAAPAHAASGASADLWQARNGTPTSPSDPVEWVKGNVGAANSHYVEGYSVPYRLVITGLTTGYHNLLIEWDIKQGGKHTIDYLTHYSRLLPHNQFFDHTKPEAIQPLDGVSGSFGDSNIFPIPTPSILDTPVPGQPAASFDALPSGERVMTIWNGIITNLTYPVQGSLSNDTAATRLSIDFLATDSTVVIAWGGHIASQLDWGADNSAVSINGSPYHTRKISLDGGGGNQDRSLQAQAVLAPISCDISGPFLVCPGGFNIYQAFTDATNSSKTYRWSLTNNSSGALMVGATNGPSVEVQAGGNGSYTLQVIIGAGGVSSICSTNVAVVDTTPPLITCPTNLVVDCAGPSGAPVSFDTAASDDCDTNVQVVCTPPSGSAFSIGVHTVICVATDFGGNRNQCQFTVTVQDVVAPQIVCPANMTLAENLPDSGSAVVSFLVPVATDNCSVNPAVDCSPPSGSALPVGVNRVICTATDDAGNTNACSFTVRVIGHQLTVTSTDDSGPGTLRQALLDANDSPAPNLVVFNLPGPGHTINLLSPLPVVADEVFLDGWSQPGFSGTPEISLNGTEIDPAADGLVIAGGNSTVRGLVLNGFANALRIEGTGGNVVQGNYIGIDFTGFGPASNSANGIWIQAPGNLIGGALSSEANRIAFNGGKGVSLDPSAGSGNAIRGNAIFSNAQLGIDLGADGVTANDAADGDAGPNDYQNFPVLNSAVSIAGVTTIGGTFNSAANATFQIEFFINDATNATGFGEGRVLLGITMVTTDGNGNKDFLASFSFAATANQFITATATDGTNNTSEFSQAIRVKTPPVITQQPVGTNVSLGTPVVLCVTAIGTEPLIYQWRHNGANIPDETNACMILPSVELANGGSYTVIVGNELDAIASEAALLRLTLSNAVAAADNFVDRVSLMGTNGLAAGRNVLATLEPGEPVHAGKPGGKSVWYTWQAPVTGIATFGTKGSTFDTLLAVYTGSAVTILEPVASDEDQGGFFTSGIRFNAIAGTQYQIAIDGYGGAEGDFIFGWQEEDTPHLLALIRSHPASQAVAPGGEATFTVDAVRVCGHGHQDCPDPNDYPGGRTPLLTYQWLFNGNLIDGATNSDLTVMNVQPDALGNYVVLVTVQYPTQTRTIASQPASLQINFTGDAVQNVLATDKFLDTANAPQPITLGGGTVLAPFGAAAFSEEEPLNSVAASVVVRGYTGSQVFNTAGSATEAGEEPICGVMGGASQWLSFVALESGTFHLDTEGSSYDTVIAVFIRSPTNATKLQQVKCDNNSGRDGRDSKLEVPVQAGRTNFIVIDGVNSATGVLQLNYSLVTPTRLSSLGVTVQSTYRLRVNGHAAMRFTIQRSSDFVNWTSIFTTNSATGTFDFTDPSPGGDSKRYYRALMLP